MNLPPLPLRSILTPDLPAVWGYTFEQMQADRKQVREYALEEAALECDVHADGDNDATYIAAKIRSFK